MLIPKTQRRPAAGRRRIVPLIATLCTPKADAAARPLHASAAARPIRGPPPDPHEMADRARAGVDNRDRKDCIPRVNSNQFKRWLAKRGCTFEEGKGGHLRVRRGDRFATLPMHGSRKKIRKGGACYKEATRPDGEIDDGVLHLRAGVDTVLVTVLVTVPDIPEAITFGETEAEVRSRAVDAIETAIGGLIKHGRDVPLPSPAAGRPTVTLPATIAAKVALYRALRASGTTKAELGRRLGWHRPQVRRLLDVDHSTRIDHLERALALLGKRLDVRVRDAA